jgi:solute carrier family 34 (sodium-dependent phosphate cotransporter)
LTGWAYIGVVVIVVLLLLYFFMVGLDLLSTSFQVVSGCTAGSLLDEDTNPVASLLIGIVATALLQSSSTTSSIVVTMCGAGLDVQAGIYLIMGANIGTSVTSIIVSLTHMGDSDEIEAAFAGSSLNYLFNIYTAVVLFPLEVGTQYLYQLTEAMLPTSVGGGDTWNSPIKAIVSPLTKTLIIANKNLVTDISTGAVADCDEYYPVHCDGGTESYETCTAGLIACNKATNRCPAFFQVNGSKTDDLVSGYVCLVLSVAVLSMCLVFLVAVLRTLLLGASRRIVYKATKMNGILAVLIGIGVTVLVQSSSVTTSALVPLAGVGVLKLEDMYP